MDDTRGVFTNQFTAGKAALQSKLEGCRDLTEVEDAVRNFWDTMQHGFTEKVQDLRMRELGYEIVMVSKSAIACMLSVSQADVLFRAPTLQDAPRKKRSFDWKKYIGAGASALLTAYLLMSGMWIPMVVSAVVTGWQTVALRRDEIKLNAPAALPEAQGVPKADIVELMRRLEKLAMNMDSAFERMAGDAGKALLPEKLQWTSAQLEAVQTLWEALHLSDGDYALKTLPQLILALEQQGLTICEYSESTAGCFDMLPGVQDGYTIRPALMLGDKVVARGQVTRAMSAAATAAG